MKYTEKGLPVVTEQLVASLFDRYADRQGGSFCSPDHTDWGQYLTDVQRRLIGEQPHLVAFAESQVGKYPREMHAPMFEVLVGMYALLELQAEDEQLARMAIRDHSNI